ncbi:MAG: class I SAM-dependent methyltransferase [Pseudomonadota bacterium]
MDERAIQRLSGRLDAHWAQLVEIVGQLANVLRSTPPRNVHELRGLVRAIDAAVLGLNPIMLDVNRELAAAAAGTTQLRQIELVSRINNHRAAAHRWHQIRDLVERQSNEPRTRLMRPVPSTRRFRDEQTRLADDLFNALHTAISKSKQDPAAASLGAFPDIGLNNSDFVELTHAAYRVLMAMGRASGSFLDVGCGAGIKLIGASRFFGDVAGIDVDAGYISTARQLLRDANLGRVTLIHGNALTFEHYGHYDLIYFFRPLRDDALLLELERRIATNAADGTLLLAPYVGFGYRFRELGCRRLARGLYIKGAGYREAQALVRRAIWTGPAVRPPRDPLPGLWEPVLRASHAWGFDVNRAGRLDGA